MDVVSSWVGSQGIFELTIVLEVGLECDLKVIYAQYYRRFAALCDPNVL